MPLHLFTAYLDSLRQLYRGELVQITAELDGDNQEARIYSNWSDGACAWIDTVDLRSEYIR